MTNHSHDASGICLVGIDWGTIMHLVGDWIQHDRQIPLIASGMITSRQGWIEIEYLGCPTDVSQLVNQAVQHRLQCGNLIRFISGVRYLDGSGLPDVMRGEETQIAGLFAQSANLPSLTDGPMTVVLPGTHSKWVTVDENRCIVAFRTFMTGEMFALLGAHSILRHSLDVDSTQTSERRRAEDDDLTAFRRGVDSVYLAGGQILNRRLQPAEASEYLSGMLIGSELHEGLQMSTHHAPAEDRQESGKERRSRKERRIVLIGDGALVQRYASAFEHLGHPFQTAPADTTARGLWLQHQPDS